MYANGQLLAQIENDNIYYVHNDYLGTPQTITDEDQKIVWEAAYSPFGQATIITQKITNNVRFPGQYFDRETGLYYNYFRFYDPQSGRYITSDPIGLDGGLNTYSYALVNPINSIDPLGLEALIDVQASFGGQLGVSGRIGPLNVKADINIGAIEQSFSNPSGSVSQSFALTGTVGPLTLGPQVSRTVVGMPVRGRTSIISMLRRRDFQGSLLFEIANKNSSEIETTQSFNDFGSGDFVLGLGGKVIIGIETKINLSELGRQFGQTVAEIVFHLQSSSKQRIQNLELQNCR